MGLEIDREEFDEADEERFAERLRDGLDALGRVLARPGFGEGPPSLGMELELSLVDAAGRPLPANVEVLATAGHHRLAVELDRFNVEYNSRPVALAGRPFGRLADDLAEALARVGDAAARHGGRVAAIGILPTLRERDLQSDALTDLPRFRALSHRLRRARGGPFLVSINGTESLAISCDDVTLEGANTSLQVHLRLPPRGFADAFNAAQIATAPVLAVSGNSPVLAGRLLWEETRVALFRQAVDEREPTLAWRPPRVSYGHGWVRTGPLELFSESVALHPPLLPVVGDEDPLRAEAAGRVPQLHELRLHNGTVWSWNRAVYDPEGDGHVRIELRSLPAGPTVTDMTANAAFLVGLTVGLADQAHWMTAALPFRHAERNFLKAAREGMAGTLLWPATRAPSPRPVPVPRLVDHLLTVADAGLAEHGVAADERSRCLGVIADRVATGRTGARWQRLTLERLEPRLGRERALAAMLEAYLQEAASGRPVHEWTLEGGRGRGRVP
jgi:gamma-glutamyl:cysteine ligase YbdK (ATP-grasp superfamily)